MSLALNKLQLLINATFAASQNEQGNEHGNLLKLAGKVFNKLVLNLAINSVHNEKEALFTGRVS